MMYIDADGRTWGIFKAMGQALDYAWGKANQFAQWADQVGIPSVNIGYGMSSSGQIQPVGDINGHPLFSNESQYEAASQNAVNAINDARGDYFSQQQMNANYSQQLNNKVMSIPYATIQNNKNVAQSGGGPGWEVYAGTATSIASEMYYSKTYGTWMGKNFKMYQQTFHGNGTVGGMNKFGRTTSNTIKWAGRILGAWNAFSINEQRRNGQIDNTQWITEQGSNAVSTLGGIYGSAWGIGWEAGRFITKTEWYQKAKFNMYYNYWEGQIGSPSQSNEYLWIYFYQNYKP